MLDDSYLQQLAEEKQILHPSDFAHTIRLLEHEITRVKSNGTDQPQTSSGFKEDTIKLTEKIVVPVDQFPRFNFVGKLLGPKGNTLKRLQGNTKTRISILGRGSTRNKEKEEEQSQSEDPKHEHLKEPLHVLVEAEAVKSEAYKRMGTALEQINRYLEPENDELRQEQMREMAHLAGKSSHKQLDKGSNNPAMYTLGLPAAAAQSAFVLPSSMIQKPDGKGYKMGVAHNGSYEVYTDSGYQIKKMKSFHDSYGDY